MICELSEQAARALLSAAADFEVDHEELLGIYVLMGTNGITHPEVLAFWLRVSKGQAGSV
ncbi:MAG TPA: hypothetical protein PKD04_10580 [Rhodocyclaceae bacterium]|nr:hypothetical protein [Rhodocyclaceae bacterium]